MSSLHYIHNSYTLKNILLHSSFKQQQFNWPYQFNELYQLMNCLLICFLSHYLALTFLEFKSFSARSCPVVAVGFSNSFSASFKYCSNFCFSVSYCSHSWTFCCNKIAYFLYNQGLPFQRKTLLFPCCILLLGSSVCNRMVDKIS